MTAISGLNCIGLWFSSGPVGAFLRMCLGSSVWQAGLTGYSLSWNVQATRWGSSLFRLRLSAPSIAATGSGLWPTETETDSRRRPCEGNVRLYRAKVVSGEMEEGEAEALLNKSVWEA